VKPLWDDALCVDTHIYWGHRHGQSLNYHTEDSHPKDFQPYQDPDGRD
jgi:hypothetical protein